MMTCGGALKSLNLVYLISSANLLVNLVNAVSYGPSLVSLTRWDRLVRGPTIFNPDTGRVISLEDYPNYSVVIPLAPDNPKATSNQVFIARRVSGPGEFTVEAPPGYGVMAVIQSLDLRVADEACNDFILFSEVDGTSAGGAETTGTCGKTEASDISSSPQGLTGPRSFSSPSGRMKVLFYHGFIWGLVRNFNFDIFDSSLNPELKVEIVFTAYKDCPKNETLESLPSEPTSLSESLSNPLAPCSAKSNTCIREELFCDRIINCGGSEDFSSDENPLTCLSNEAKALERLSKFLTSTPALAPSEPETTPSSTSTSEQPQSSTEPSTRARSKTTVTPEQVSSEVAGVGSLGLQKFRTIEITSPEENVKRIVVKGPGTKSEEKNLFLVNRTTSTPNSLETTTTTVKQIRRGTTKPTTRKTTTRMPLEDGRLFVEAPSFIEDTLSLSDNDGLKDGAAVAGAAAATAGQSLYLIIIIVSVTIIILILLGLLRIYYCYNKVIWNPHGNLQQDPSPPGTPNKNFMKKKMRALAMESEEVFNEKQGKLNKEHPPSYEILFPLPEEKDVHHYEVLKV